MEHKSQYKSNTPPHTKCTSSYVSLLVNTLSLTKVVLGSTLVSYPGMFKENGIIPMILSLVGVGGVLCSSSLYFLYVSSLRVHVKTYEELGGYVLGERTKRVIRTCIFLIGYFSLVIYIKISSELLSTLSPSLSPTLSTVYVSLLCGTLSCFSSSLKRLKFVNLIGLFSILLLLLMVLSQCVSKGVSLKGVNLIGKEYKFNTFGYISLCFCSHFVIIPFMHSLKDSKEGMDSKEVRNSVDMDSKEGIDNEYNKCIEESIDYTPSTHKVVILGSSCLSVLVYIFVGLFGYLSFPSTLPNWAMNPLSPPLSLSLSFLLLFVIVLSFPLCVVSSKNILSERGGVVEKGIILILTLSSCLLSVGLKDFSLINTLFLSFGSLVMFVYPPLFYYKVVYPLSLLERVLIGINLLAGGILMMVSFKEIVERINIFV